MVGNTRRTSSGASCPRPYRQGADIVHGHRRHPLQSHPCSASRYFSTTVLGRARVRTHRGGRYHPLVRMLPVERSRRGCSGARAARRWVGLRSHQRADAIHDFAGVITHPALAGCACDTCGDRCRQLSRRRQHLPAQTAAAAAAAAAATSEGCETCQRSESEAVALSDNRALSRDATWVSLLETLSLCGRKNSVPTIPLPSFLWYAGDVWSDMCRSVRRLVGRPVGRMGWSMVHCPLSIVHWTRSPAAGGGPFQLPVQPEKKLCPHHTPPFILMVCR